MAARADPLAADLVVNTGDNLAHPKAVPSVVQSMGELLSWPGVFVFGSNDYFGPRLKNPMNYVTNPGHRGSASRCPGRICVRRSPSAAGWT